MCRLEIALLRMEEKHFFLFPRMQSSSSCLDGCYSYVLPLPDDYNFHEYYFYFFFFSPLLPLHGPKKKSVGERNVCVQ